MDPAYKLRRIREWASTLGWREAIRFEMMWSLRRRRVKLRVPGFPRRFTVRRNGSDLSVFEQVMIDRELGGYLPEGATLVIDGGANIGLSTAFYACALPQALVVAVEPSAENCALMKENCEGLPNVEMLEAGLWPESRALRISNPGEKPWAFRCETVAEGAVGGIPGFTVGDVIDRAGRDRCDLLKLDIEGAEEQLFAVGAERWLPRVDAVLVEVHTNAAMDAIERACPPNAFHYTALGEKHLIRPR